jgi:hypothetical protein
MPDFSDAQTIGILTATGMILALVAAVTGIISVRQGARAWRASQRPLLQAFVTQNPEDGLVTATISNTGAGSANGTTFVIVFGDSFVWGLLGILEPGRRVVITTHEPLPNIAEGFAGLVSCYENGTAQAFFFTGERRIYKTRPWRRRIPTDDEMLAEVYPEVSLRGLRQVKWHVPMVTQP